jgi:hypothetical protein
MVYTQNQRDSLLSEGISYSKEHKHYRCCLCKKLLIKPFEHVLSEEHNEAFHVVEYLRKDFTEDLDNGSIDSDAEKAEDLDHYSDSDEYSDDESIEETLLDFDD